MVSVQINIASFYYPLTKEPALTDIDLKIEKGTFLTILGKNGAGKSTLCYLMAGYGERFFNGTLQGDIKLDQQSIRSISQKEMISSVGFLSQNPANQISGVKETVEEEIAYRLENLGIDPLEMHSRIDWSLSQMGIRSLANRYPNALSGGQLQKVVLSTVLAFNPSLLILDEPFSRMDPKSSEELLQLILKIRQSGTTIIATENRIDKLSLNADKVLLLAKGKLLAYGKPHMVLKSAAITQSGIREPKLTKLARKTADIVPSLASQPLPLTMAEAVTFFSKK